MTQTTTSEAHWSMYSQNQIGIKLVFFRNELLRLLESYTNEYDIYIGKVQYCQPSEIVKVDKISKMKFEKPLPTTPEEVFVRLMLLKRVAYAYEDEIRIILIRKADAKSTTGVTLKYDCPNPSLIYGIAIDPTVLPYTEKLLKSTFVNEYGFSPIAKQGTNEKEKRVAKSDLYNESTQATLIWDNASVV